MGHVFVAVMLLSISLFWGEEMCVGVSVAKQTLPQLDIYYHTVVMTLNLDLMISTGRTWT